MISNLCALEKRFGLNGWPDEKASDGTKTNCLTTVCNEQNAPVYGVAVCWTCIVCVCMCVYVWYLLLKLLLHRFMLLLIDQMNYGGYT